MYPIHEMIKTSPTQRSALASQLSVPRKVNVTLASLGSVYIHESLMWFLSGHYQRVPVCGYCIFLVHVKDRAEKEIKAASLLWLISTRPLVQSGKLLFSKTAVSAINV